MFLVLRFVNVGRFSSAVEKQTFESFMETFPLIFWPIIAMVKSFILKINYIIKQIRLHLIRCRMPRFTIAPLATRVWKEELRNKAFKVRRAYQWIFLWYLVLSNERSMYLSVIKKMSMCKFTTRSAMPHRNML